jgi:nucleoside-diphosphate-sugar epimerase
MPDKNQTVIITGGTGFIGSRIAVRLIEEGFNVRVITRLSSDIDEIEPYLDRMELFRFDGKTNSLIEYFQAEKADVVVHLASFAVFQHESDQVEAMIDANLKFGTQVLEAMATAGVDSFINTGSFAEYFEGDGYDPSGLYAATKKAFEDIMTFYINAHELNAVTLKLFDVYGPGDPRKKIINLIIQAIKNDEKLIMTVGEQYLDLTHINDVVNAYVHTIDGMLKGNFEGEDIFAISSGAQIKVRDLVAVIEKVMAKAAPVELGGRDYRFREIMKPWQGGAALPGWEARINLEEGIKSLIP